jgi:hypothetical protein
VLAAISERERTRTRLRRERDMLRETSKAAPIDQAEIRAKLMARLAEWKNLLRKETLWTRQIITKLLDGKITLTPTRDESGKPAYEMRAKLSLGGFFSGILYASAMMGRAKSWWLTSVSCTLPATVRWSSAPSGFVQREQTATCAFFCIRQSSATSRRTRHRHKSPRALWPERSGMPRAASCRVRRWC